MSLKAFHLFFVVVAIFASSAYGMWCAVSALREGAAWLPVAGVALLTGAALLVHGVYFFRQTEKEPWL